MPESGVLLSYSFVFLKVTQINKTTLSRIPFVQILRTLLPVKIISILLFRASSAAFAVAVGLGQFLNVIKIRVILSVAP